MADQDPRPSATRRRRRRLQAIAAAIGLMLIGAVIGPVLIAAALAGYPASEPESRTYAAARLLTAYDALFPPELHMTVIDFTSPVDECGYDYDTLFLPDHMAPRGYFDLFGWRQSRHRERADLLRIRALEAGFGQFQSRFLRRCMEATLFARPCGSFVRGVLEQARDVGLDARMRDDALRDKRTACTYLDGVAARRGLPLARARRFRSHD